MGSGKILTHVIILFATLTLLIKLFFNSQIFIREFILFFIFSFIAIISIGALSFSKRWSHPLLTILYALIIINFVYIYFNTLNKSLFWFLVAGLFSVIGFLVSVSSIEKPKKNKKVQVIDLPKEKKKAKTAKPPRKRKVKRKEKKK